MIEYFNEAKKKKKTKLDQNTVINKPNKDLEIFAPFIFGRQYMSDYGLLFSPKGVDTKYWEKFGYDGKVLDQNQMDYMKDQEDYIIKDVDNYRFISIKLFFNKLTGIDEFLTKDNKSRTIYGAIGIVVKKEYLNEYKFKLNKKYISNIYKKYITENFFNKSSDEGYSIRKKTIQSLPFGYNTYNGDDILFKLNNNIDNIKLMKNGNKTIYDLSNPDDKDILINYFTNKTNESVSFMSSCARFNLENNIKLFNDIGFESDYDRGKIDLKTVYKNKEESNKEESNKEETKGNKEEAESKIETNSDKTENPQNIENEIDKKLEILANENEEKFNELVDEAGGEQWVKITEYSNFEKIKEVAPTSYKNFISNIAKDENLLNKLNELVNEEPVEQKINNEPKSNNKDKSNEKIQKISKKLEELGDLNFEEYNEYITKIKDSRKITSKPNDKTTFIEINNIDNLLIDKSNYKKNNISSIITNNNELWNQLINEISKKETFNELLDQHLNIAKNTYNEIEKKIEKLYDLDEDQFNNFLKETDKDKFNIISNGKDKIFLDTFKMNNSNSYKDWIKTLSTNDNQGKLNDLINKIEKSNQEKKENENKLIDEIEQKLNDLSSATYGTNYYNEFINKYAQEPKSYLQKTSIGETYYSIKSNHENLCKSLIDKLINNKNSSAIIKEIDDYIKKANQDKKEKEQELEKTKQENKEREDELMASHRESEANRKQLENNINYFLNSKDESGNFIWDGLNTTINKILINLTNIFNCITDILKKDDFKEDIQKSNNILNEFYTKVENIKIENDNCFIKFYEICQQINMSIDNSKDKFKSSNLNINNDDTVASIDLKALDSMQNSIKNKTEDDQIIESFNKTIVNITNLFTKIKEISDLKKSLITNIINEYNKLYNKK